MQMEWEDPPDLLFIRHCHGCSNEYIGLQNVSSRYCPQCGRDGDINQEIEIFRDDKDRVYITQERPCPSCHEPTDKLFIFDGETAEWTGIPEDIYLLCLPCCRKYEMLDGMGDVPSVKKIKDKTIVGDFF